METLKDVDKSVKKSVNESAIKFVFDSIWDVSDSVIQSVWVPMLSGIWNSVEQKSKELINENYR